MRRSLGIIAAAAVVLAGACGSSGHLSGGSSATTSGPAKAGPPFVIYAPVATSGPLGDLGKTYVRGLKQAADEVNAAGGILGRPVQIDAEDSQGDPTKSVGIVTERLNSHKPDAVYAGTTSNEVLANLPAITASGVLAFAIVASEAANKPDKYPLFFSPSSHAEKFADFLAGALKAKGYQKIGVLLPNDAFGQSVRASYGKAFGAAGLTVSDESVAPTDLDVTAALSRLQSKKPDAVVFEGLGPLAPVVLKSRTKVGMTTPTFAGSSVTADIAGLVSPADLKGVTLATFAANIVPPAASQTKAYSAFLAGLQAGGPITQAFIVPAWPHDMVWMLALAAKQAGSTDPKALAKAMETLKPPATPPFVGWPAYQYSATDHFNQAVDASGYGLVANIQVRVNGQWPSS